MDLPLKLLMRQHNPLLGLFPSLGLIQVVIFGIYSMLGMQGCFTSLCMSEVICNSEQVNHSFPQSPCDFL